ncbi:hypothetical protein C8R46DRAFT_1047386 [Mycena filopes]|nr:hypothetical protein C8R46DRAFT_1047386 [Mycena filopes]
MAHRRPSVSRPVDPRLKICTYSSVLGAHDAGRNGGVSHMQKKKAVVAFLATRVLGGGFWFCAIVKGAIHRVTGLNSGTQPVEFEPSSAARQYFACRRLATHLPQMQISADADLYLGGPLWSSRTVGERELRDCGVETETGERDWVGIGRRRLVCLVSCKLARAVIQREKRSAVSHRYRRKAVGHNPKGGFIMGTCKVTVIWQISTAHLAAAG